jgi:hypothetical protein
MQETQAIIERIKRISATVQRLDVAVDKSQREIGPGQIFLARTTESLDPYLREPWTPVRRDGSRLVFERPGGRSYNPGQIVTLLGPVGKAIPTRESTRALLLIAYEATPAALVMLAQNTLAKGGSVTLVLFGAALHYPLEALPQEIEILKGDDHSNWPDQSDTLRWAEQIVAIAPPPFDLPYYGQLLAKLREVRIEIPPQYVYGLFQPPMPCGIGACQACLIRCGGEEIPACVEGPAFDLLSVHALKAGAG